MIFGHSFYHGTLRKYVIMFGNLFNDMQINRFDSNGNKTQTVLVPISYGPKQRFVERSLADPTGLKPLSITLPTLGFAMTQMTYAPTRKLNTTLKYKASSSADSKQFLSTYSPVPYDMNFSLYIFTRNSEDGIQILEQIVPFFTPDFTVTMKSLPELNINLDIPIELQSVTSDDTYEGDFDTRRVLTWQLDFVVKGYLFGPILGQNGTQANKVIDTAKISVYNGLDSTTPVFTYEKND
jgi:hypothetical protein